MVTGAERFEMRVTEKGEGGGALYHSGSSECVKFLVRHTKLSTTVHYEKDITTLYKKLTWGAHCTTTALILHPYSFFKASGQTFGRTGFKLGGSLVTMVNRVP